MRYCPHCGEELPEKRGRFCSYCGKPLEGEQPKEQTFSQAEEDASSGALILPDSAVTVVEENPHQQLDKEAREEFSRMKEEADNLPPEPPIIVIEPGEDPNQPPARWKLSVKRMTLVWGAVSLAFVLLLTGGVVWFLRGSSPEKFVSQYVQAAANGQEDYLAQHTSRLLPEGFEEGQLVKIYSDLFAQHSQEDFSSHLLATLQEESQGQEEYSSFRLVSTKGFMGRKSYGVEIGDILVEYQTNLPSMSVLDNGQAVSSRQVGNVIQFYLLPGSHSIQGVYQEYGMEFPIDSRQFTSFSAQPVYLGEMNRSFGKAEIQLTGQETGLKVLINDYPTRLAPQNGYIIIDPAFEGMEILVKSDQYVQRFTVGEEERQEFTPYYSPIIIDGASAELNPFLLKPIQMTNEQMVTVAADSFFEYYQSYLKSINQWNTGYLENVYSESMEEIIHRMESNNEDFIFDLKSVTVDKDSGVRYLSGKDLFLEFSVKVSYNYAYREDSMKKWYADGNTQRVTMIYPQGKKRWQVFDTRIDSTGYLGENTLQIEV